MSILVLIECASSQVPSSGKCPDIKTQTNFDLNKYVGVWHEIYKFYTSFESNQKCIQAKYTLEPNGHVRVWYTALNTHYCVCRDIFSNFCIYFATFPLLLLWWFFFILLSFHVREELTYRSKLFCLHVVL
ncbi:hypothetical protein ACJMK2_009563 [Sinanodonta woodiana]|uniref:Lipocalin/cytosolic fatty-acid binding domain-containing protein n=1 Tax=Sinanodonta woodiana TaxID=1069815 RepID=A0ABD3VE98_SINWO